MNEQLTKKSPKDKSLRTPSKEDSDKDLIKGPLDECLIVKKASILRKSKSDASSSSYKISRQKAGSSLDTTALSSSESSFGSALSTNPSHEKIEESELEVTATEAVIDSTNKEHDNLLLSPSTVQICEESEFVDSTQSLTSLNCDDVPLDTSLQCASNFPSTTIEPSDADIKISLTNDTKDVDNSIPNYSEDDFKSLSSEILREAITETENDENSMLNEADGQDLAEMLTALTVSQSCLETLEENRSKRIEILEIERDKEAAVNKELVKKLSELQEYKNKLSNLITSMESSYTDTYATLTETHAFQMEAQRLEAEKDRNDLLAQINDLSAKLVVSESLLAGKEELEGALQEQMSKLNKELDEKEEHCKEELKDVISKKLSNEAVMEAKDEVVMDDLLNLGEIQQCENIDRAWLVADLRRAESELSLNGGMDTAWMKSNLNCNFMTMHSEPLKELESIFPSPRSKKKSTIPVRVKRNASIEDLTKGKTDMEGKIRELTEQLDQCKSQVEWFEKEKIAYVNKNASLEDKLDSANNRIEDMKSEKERMLSKIKQKDELLKSAEDKIAALEPQKNALEKMEMNNKKLNEKLLTSKRDNDSLLKKIDSYKKDVSELQAAVSSTNDEKVKLLEELNKLKDLEEQKKALEEELTQLKSSIVAVKREEVDDSISETNIDESIKLQLHEAQLQCRRLESLFNQSRLSLDTSRRNDSTVYLDYFPSPLLDVSCQVDAVDSVETLTAACQTERELMDAECVVETTSVESQTDKELIDDVHIVETNSAGHQTEKEAIYDRFAELEAELAHCKKCLAINTSRRPSLEKDLETSWTERCEVEEQLACALAENAVLARRVHQIEEASRHMTALMTPAVRSASAWHEIYGSLQEILNSLSIVNSRGTEEINLHSAKDISELRAIQLVDGEVESLYQLNAGIRMEPEGGVIPLDNEVILASDSEEPTQSEGALLDQNSSVLIDVVQELLRYMGACEEDANEALPENERSTNISTLLDTSCGPDLRGELKRCVGQLKEEVSHIFAISRRSDNAGSLNHLQEEIQSLEQQVASSDKQVKSMRLFVDEQAAEREIERDEFGRQIAELNEIIKQKERQLVSFEQLKADVEHFEQQLQDTNCALKKSEEDRSDLTSKLTEAMNKIWTMRDIICNLEKEIACRSEDLEGVRVRNTQLHDQLQQLDKISLEKESANRDSYSDLMTYVGKLEEEVTALRHRVELTNPESLAAVRASLRDLEFLVARSTKDIELVIVTASGFSSASEDLSTRELADATRCPTPDEMKGDMPLGLDVDVDRLKERILKHAQLEGVALKRLRELEHHGRKLDELHLDLEVAQQKLETCLLENASLKSKIEEERPKALQKQLLVDMEHRLRQVERDLETAQDTIRAKEQLLFQSRLREEQLVDALSAQKAIFCNDYLKQNAVKDELLSERQRAEENAAKVQELSELPQVYNALLAKKNDDIDLLRQQVSSRDFSTSSFVDFCSQTHASISSGKRVKFAVPESFVASTITPIRVDPPSILRNAFETNNQWNAPPLSIRQGLPLERVSSIAALQLSPRGEKNLPYVHDSSSSFDLQPLLQEKIPSKLSLPFVPDDTLVPDLSADLGNARKEILNLQSDLQAKIRKCEELEETLHELQQNVDEKEQKLQEVEETLLNHKNAETDTLEKQLNQARKDVKCQYEIKIMQIKAELGLKNDEIISAKNQNIEMQAKYEEDLKAQHAEIERLMQRVVVISNELECSESALQACKIEVERLNTLASSLEAELKTEKQANKKNADTAEAQLQEIIDKLTKQQEESSALKDRLHHAYEEIKVVNGQRDGIASSWEEEKSNMESLLAEKIGELMESRRLLAVKENEVMLAVEEINKNKEQLEKLQKDLETLEMQHTRKEHELSSVQKLLAVKNEEIIRVRRESEEKMSILKARLDKDKEELDSQREKLDSVLSELEKFNVDKTKVNQDLVLRREEVERLQERLAYEENVRKDLEEKVKEQNEVIRSHFADLNEKASLLAQQQKQLVELPRKVSADVTAGGDNGRGTESRLLRENSAQAVTGEKEDVEENIKLLERLVEGLETRLSREISQREEEAALMTSLRIALEESVDKQVFLQSELAAVQERCEGLTEELTRSSGLLRLEIDSSRAIRESCLRREEELINQLSASQSQIRKLTHIAESQALHIDALSQLHSHDINTSWRVPVNGVVPRLVRSAGDGAESSQEWRLKVSRLESYRKALVWQKQYLVRSGHRGSSLRGSRRRITLRTVGILIVAMFRMKFLVRRWRSRLPPLSAGNERRLSLLSPPSKDPGLRPRVAH